MPDTDEPVEYDLTDWTNDARTLLSRSLDGEEIAHDWIAGTLQVDGASEARVDQLIDEIDELAGAETDGADDVVVVVGGDDIAVEGDDTGAGGDVRGDAVGLAADDQVAYDDDEWDAAALATLSSLLRAEGIPFAWEAGTLVVNARDEARVDVLVEQVGSSPSAPLDPDEPKVVYELDGWDEGQRGALADRLLAAGVAHQWDDDDNLVVLERDEAAIDPLLEGDGAEELDGDVDGDGGGDDGLAAQEAMSDLFVAADRLLHDPDDATAVRTLTDAGNRVEAMALPYGFEPAVWDDIVVRSAALRSMVAAGIDDDADADGGASDTEPEAAADVGDAVRAGT